MQELHSVFGPKTALVLVRTMGTILGTLVPGVCEIDPMLLRFVWPCLKTPDRILATWKPRWCQSRVAAADKRRPIREQPRPLLLCTLERPHFRTRILGSQKFLRSSASWTSQRPDCSTQIFSDHENFLPCQNQKRFRPEWTEQLAIRKKTHKPCPPESAAANRKPRAHSQRHNLYPPLVSKKSG